ncbi:baseplate J/gp47 family protein [Sporosarcina sp. resist]|uniref:baseplate J/gp47 family protein n=1 Tax=Sporosarcina sp. resist TaxID=2762563 RepID=UPI00164D8019|nr:baseplate J/gp47 family protein [Sporosarcina sp. resist]QNK86285.1 baseplate J/gp47 family protein [Sporosarcina sp. resist]
MFEHITQEQLLDDALNRVKTDVDKREGAIVYDSLSPSSTQAKELYIAMDGMIVEMYGDTASREFLIKLSLDRGISPYLATKAILKGEFNIDVPIGSRFSLDDLNYIATERISFGVFKVQCETSGYLGNYGFGTLIPIEYIDGLTSAILTELLIPGEDDEDTEDLRKRYLDSFDALAFGGNRKDYKEKVHELQGVSGVKVYRAWQGGSTVKLVIMDSQFKPPSAALIDALQTAIDPMVNQGEGLGIAPIGHVVSIFGVQEFRVDITLNVTFESGYSWPDVEISIQELVDAYFLELKRGWEDSTQTTIRIIQLETRILEVEGVLDIQNTLLNNVAENLVLDADSIPDRGEIIG